MIRKNIQILHKNHIENRIIEYEPAVIISNGFECFGELASTLNEEGFETIPSEYGWPRDKLVSYSNKYISSRENARLGSGGCIVPGNGYILISDRVEKEHKKELKKLEEFLKCPLYIISSTVTSSKHIDLTTMPIPQNDVLFVMENQYQKSRGTIDYISRKHSQEIIRIRNNDETGLWPLNCLILEKENEPFIIANENTKEFLKKLEECNLKYRTVNAWKSYVKGGSIRCRTNTVPNKDFIGEFDL